MRINLKPRQLGTAELASNLILREMRRSMFGRPKPVFKINSLGRLSKTRIIMNEALALVFVAGTKFIQASEEITKKTYCKIRGWTVPENEDPEELGRLVVYPQPEGKPHNVTGYEGYVSWSPKFAFDEAYRENGKLSFGEATKAAKEGKKIARIGWNGANMYAVIMPGYPEGIEVNETTQKAHQIPVGTKLVYRPYWQLYTAQQDVAMWAPSGSDSLAEDWCILD